MLDEMRDSVLVGALLPGAADNPETDRDGTGMGNALGNDSNAVGEKGFIYHAITISLTDD
jgi:hypothetical protein